MTRSDLAEYARPSLVLPNEEEKIDVNIKEHARIRAQLCRLPATWDHLAAGFASGMGPPPLPVMGPP
jgi:hypothetical protein